MKKVLNEMKTFFECKIYVVFLALVTTGAYGYAITHYTIGMDDTAVALYYEDGLAPYVGRWSLFVLNKIFNIADFVPWLTELASVVVLMLSVTLWCLLWKRICEPKLILPVWSYVFPASVFISCPLISEVFVFYLHNGICFGYGITALAVWWLLNSLQKDIEKKNCWKSVLVSAILLTVAIGCYESFAIVYIMGAIMCFFLVRCLYERNEDGDEVQWKLFLWLRNGIITMILSLGFRFAILQVLNVLYRLDKFSVYNVLYRSLFGEIFTQKGELGMVLKRFFVKYYVNAIAYFPILILVVALIVLVLYAIYYSVKKKDGIILLLAGVVIALPIVLALIEGLDTRYRTAQYVPLICAFAILLFLVEMYKSTWHVSGMVCAYLLLSVLIFNQCSEMTKWFYVDDMKYQYTKDVMNQIATDLRKDYDTSKPIVFKGAHPVPYSICEDAFVSFSSWKYRAICKLTDPIDSHLKEKYFSPVGFGFAEGPLQSTITWGITAFDGTSQQLIEFWKMHGHDSFRCETDLNVISEAERYGNEIGIAGFPKQGYIKDCGDYILVSFSDAE